MYRYVTVALVLIFVTNYINVRIVYTAVDILRWCRIMRA